MSVIASYAQECDSDIDVTGLTSHFLMRFKVRSAGIECMPDILNLAKNKWLGSSLVPEVNLLLFC